MRLASIVSMFMKCDFQSSYLERRRAHAVAMIGKSRQKNSTYS